jgi:D-lactate dehydrogenase
MKPKLAIFDCSPADRTYFESGVLADFDLSCHAEILGPDTAKLAPDAAAVAVYITSQVKADVIQALPQLKLIACRSTGFDNVDLAAAQARGITVCNVPTYGEHTVAEYTFMLLLALQRRLVPSLEAVRRGQIDPTQLVGTDLHGKTMGVVGAGKIGQNVIRLAQAFGMTVLAFDPFPKPELAEQNHYKYVELDELLKTADVVTLHAPATKDNYHLINAEALAKLKPTAVLINTARGTLVDAPALIEALEARKLAGAAMDVVEGENYMKIDDELHLVGQRQLEAAQQALYLDILEKLPNVILTSHNAYNSAEALQRIRETSVANIQAWHRGTPESIVKDK